MRKLTLLAIGAVLMLAQSSPALSYTSFNGTYACRGSALYPFSSSVPVFTVTAIGGTGPAAGTFSGGTLLFYYTGYLCQYSLNKADSTFGVLGDSSGLAGVLSWEGSGYNNAACISSFGDDFAFVLSQLAPNRSSPNTVQTTSEYGPSFECTQQ
jgi:hypothetical protein